MMSSTVPKKKKKKKDTKAEQLGFEVFTDKMKLGDGRMKFRADLTHAYGASFFFVFVLHTALFAD